jgi:hypothetical protein
MANQDSSSIEELESQERLTRIRKMLAEHDQLNAERDKLNAERIKLMSEEYKLFNEGRKLGQETRLAPWMIVVAALGGLGGLISIVQTLLRGLIHG